MSANKLALVYALAVKPEASYNAGGVIAAGDYVEMQEEVQAEIEYANDGARGTGAGTGGQRKGGKPSGRQLRAFEPKFEFKGSGATYTASVKPPQHNLMLMSGHSATLDATPGAARWTYRPSTSNAGTAYTSCLAALYARGERIDVTGAYADFAYEFEAGGFLMMSFGMVGLPALPVDAALPAVSYGSLPDPPKVENIGLQIGAWTPKVRKGSYKQNREHTARLDSNAAGAHAGYSPGARNPTFEVTVEAVARSTFDPDALRDPGTSMAVVLTIGTVQNNRFKHTMAQAQITDVKPDKDGSTALWVLTFRPHTSTPVTDDDSVFEAS